MSLTPWSEIVSRQASFHLLIGRLHDSFAGGAIDKFDTHRLRFATALMKRCCRATPLKGPAAVHGSREGTQPVVLVAIETTGDFVQLGSLTGSAPEAAPPWRAQSRFVLDEDLHIQLLGIAGPPDERGAGRRLREKRAADLEDGSLRWKIYGRGST